MGGDMGVAWVRGRGRVPAALTAAAGHPPHPRFARWDPGPDRPGHRPDPRGGGSGRRGPRRPSRGECSAERRAGRAGTCRSLCLRRGPPRRPPWAHGPQHSVSGRGSPRAPSRLAAPGSQLRVRDPDWEGTAPVDLAELGLGTAGPPGTPSSSVSRSSPCHLPPATSPGHLLRVSGKPAGRGGAWAQGSPRG